MVGAAFDIESYPKTFNTSSPASVKFACGTSRCLGVHRMTLDSGAWVLATRVEAGGRVVDFPRIQVAQDAFPLRVLARKDEFLVITAPTETGDTGPLGYFLVRGSDGVVTPVTSQGLPSTRPVLGASTGESWVLVWREGSGARGQVFDAQLVPRGPGAALEAATLGMMADPIPGPGQYLFGAYGNAIRLDEASGNPLDATPIVVSSLFQPPRMAGVYSDGVYQLAFGTQTIYQTRVEAATGKVLEPDDLFNQVLGPKLIATLPARATGDVDVDLVAGKVVVSEAMVSDRAGAVVVDPKTGLAAGNNSIYAVLQNSPLGDPTHEKHVLGDSVFLLDTGNLLQIGSGTQPLSPSFPSAKLALGISGIDRFGCRLAASKAGYLVVFARGSSFAQQGSEIVATRIDPTTGAFLDDPPLVVGTGENPSVASDGQNYLVSWLSTADARTHAHYRLVKADGSMTQDNSSQIFDSVQSFAPSLTFDGLYYGVSWGSRAARIDASGTFVAPAQTPSDGVFYNTGLIPTAGDPSARVAADTNQPPDHRTFLLAGETWVGASDSRNIGIVGIRSGTGAMISGGILAEKHRRPFSVSDGTRVLVLSQEEASGSWYGVFVDPVSVAAIPNTRKLMIENPTPTNPSVYVQALSFDGSSYYVVVSERLDSSTLRSTTHLRRFDGSLARLAEESGPGISLDGQFQPTWYMDATTFGVDHGLFVFRTSDVARLGFAIKGVFFTADGTQPTTPSTGGVANGGGAANGGGGTGNSAGGVSNGSGGKTASAGNSSAGAGAGSPAGGSAQTTAGGTGQTTAGG
ncbi:MAG TPA: hypothetical protein VFQ35_00615, partial [Polyangiaceae bacterium]|nr:hypothetical protein [Polyangiaceae bacterium]